MFFASGAVTSLTITAWGADTKLTFGYPALAGGAIISLAGVLTSLLPLYIIGSIIAGSGFAGTFLGALDSISDQTPPHQRGQVFSAVFITSYIAFSVPAVIAGLVVSHIGLQETVVCYVAYVLVVTVLGAGVTAWTRRRRGQEGE